MAACTISRKQLFSMGDRFLVAAEVSAGTTLSANALGLSYIDYAWIQDTGDNAAVYLTRTSAILLTLSAAPSGGTQTVFAIGY